MLRVNLDGSIPVDNPFVGQIGVRPEIFAYGFRNPFRFGIDPVSGRPWLGDVGQDTWEELDVIRAGGNYGWPGCEGTDPAGCPLPGQVPPAFQYSTGGPGGASITGGAFASCGFGAYAGQYFFGDVIAERLYRVVPNAARDGIAGPPDDFASAAGGPVDIIFGPDQSLYYVAFGSGEVRRIAPPATSCTSPGGSGSSGTTGDKLPSVSVDRVAPRALLRSRYRQRVGRLSIQVRLDEPARVTVSASVSVPAPSAARTYRWKRVRRVLPAGRTRIHLVLRPRALRALRRSARRRQLTARVKLTAVDAAANRSRAGVSIRLVAGR